MSDANFQAQVLTQLGDIKALIAETKVRSEAVSARVDSIEKTNTRQWWMHALSPLLLTATAFARKAGLL